MGKKASVLRSFNILFAALVLALAVKYYARHSVIAPSDDPRFSYDPTTMWYDWSERVPTDPRLLYDIHTPFCNIDRVPEANLSQSDFYARFYEKAPVIIEGRPGRNERFAQKVARDSLLETYANLSVILASSNTHSYEKRQSNLREYIENMMHAQTLDNYGKDTYYLFGDTQGSEWLSLLTDYLKPPYYGSEKSAVTFGIGGVSSGVPYHFHGGGYSETIIGRKRWFIMRDSPDFDPDQSQLQWLAYVYPKYRGGELDKSLQQCTIYPGDILYFPSGWYHATLNLDDYTAFVSCFIDEPSSTLYS
eukprot:TRINITY_DN3321_c0_g1::TRINITY_DN3321_c0_g1_i1::g.30997::m.30997 TRINITY_DN3321_c0_g1::TRINITY_DN3321_c0_g1_i1::g.30997  ORF type:complete len:322 (+),score=7.32,sp/Q6AY40/JMJD8_RAT/39.57/9e-49,Cupin_8/PF13621.1/1.4e-06,Cupin_4/PF08007.7/19,Cupin_4/PF08007.7/7.9e-05,JmjC/PF02373.17/0.0036,DUF3347/PF11827.3/10,DUF3347/PF11827.3/36 TRINITY_DN3321_c0_g1_i1:53-967(+)